MNVEEGCWTFSGGELSVGVVGRDSAIGSNRRGIGVFIDLISKGRNTQ